MSECYVTYFYKGEEREVLYEIACYAMDQFEDRFVTEEDLYLWHIARLDGFDSALLFASEIYNINLEQFFDSYSYFIEEEN